VEKRLPADKHNAEKASEIIRENDEILSRILKKNSEARLKRRTLSSDSAPPGRPIPLNPFPKPIAMRRRTSEVGRKLGLYSAS